jgi:ABC-type sugar transport system ATPase subunit
LLGRPFRSLARSVAEERMLQLRQLSEDYGMTVVAALDNFEEAAFFCDRIAVFDQGRIVQTGTPEDVYLEPATPASAAATGRINLLQVRRLTSSKSEHPEYKSLTTEHHFRVKKMELSKVGALNKNVLLGIRPEHISLSFGASFPEDNLIKAAISRVRFLGPSTLVEVEAEGLKLSALVQRLVGLSEGDECMLGLPPDRIHIFA